MKSQDSIGNLENEIHFQEQGVNHKGHEVTQRRTMGFFMVFVPCACLT